MASASRRTLWVWQDKMTSAPASLISDARSDCLLTASRSVENSMGLPRGLPRTWLLLAPFRASAGGFGWNMSSSKSAADAPRATARFSEPALDSSLTLGGLVYPPPD